MKEEYITIFGFNHYYGINPFKVGKQLNVLRRRIIHMMERLSEL